jgi:hypothetical protein
MHDLDRTQREFESALHELQPEHFELPGEQSSLGYEWEDGRHETAYHEAAAHEAPGSEWEAWHETSPHEAELHETGLHEAGLHEAAMHESGVHEGGLYEAGLHEGALHEGGFHESGLHEAAQHEGFEGSHESPLSEEEEMELAAELLEVTNEAELDLFLGRLIRRVGRGLRRMVRFPLLRALGGVLRPLAKVALPLAGRAFGTFLGGPLGGVVGGRLASAAGQMFGLELEGLSGEDREFEVARRFVRFASTAARSAAFAPPQIDPRIVARQATLNAARTYGRGLQAAWGRPFAARFSRPGAWGGNVPWGDAPVSNLAPSPQGLRRRGIWIRRGRRILLLGV